MYKKLYKIASKFHPAKINDLAAYLLKDEAISGKLILVATLLALIFANTVFKTIYTQFWNSDLTIGFGDFSLTKTHLHWVNEGLMAIFFLVVGLELKRELVHGELRHFKTAILPFAAAVGGMLVPALIFISLNMGRDTFDGWAIPMATDIAFAIGILALVGKAIPASVRLFLLTLAIVDDIGAVIVIAVFYNSDINLFMLAIAIILCCTVILLNKTRKLSLSLFIIIGVILWLLINASGVHASIAGAIVGLLAPTNILKSTKASITESLERIVIPLSALVVVPLFAFANTGIALTFSSFSNENVVYLSAGIILGLVIGKVVGIILASWLMIKFRFAVLPKASNWNHIIGVGLVAGIGFTVSIFVAELAFTNHLYIDIAKISIFIASMVSACVGLIFLRYRTRAKY